MSFTLPEPAAGRRPLRDHAVHFYDGSSQMAVVVSDHVAGGLAAGDGALVVATPEHINSIETSMRGRGLEVARLRDEGRFVSLDAEGTLARFMRDGRPDAQRFAQTITEALTSVKGESHVVFGEMVALLWREGRREAALALELLWSDFCRGRALSLLCAYPIQAFGAADDARALSDVCLLHSRLEPRAAEASPAPLRLDEHDHVATQLRQRTFALDREVGRRKEAEEALRRRETELAEVLDAVADGVLDLDADGRIRYANRAFLGLLGVDEADCVGSSVASLLDTTDVVQVAWAALLRGDPVRDLDIGVRDAIGSRPLSGGARRRTSPGRRAVGGGSVRRLRISNAVLRVAGRAVHMRWFVAPVR